MPVGSITIRKDKSNKLRRFIKINEPNKWLEYARFLWIKQYGNISSGCIIHHKDGNPLNDTLSNFDVLTRKEHINIHRKFIGIELEEQYMKIAIERIKNT